MFKGIKMRKVWIFLKRVLHWKLKLTTSVLKIFLFMLGVIMLGTLLTQGYRNIVFEENIIKLEKEIEALDIKVNSLEKQTFRHIRTQTRDSIYLVFSEKSHGTAFQIIWKGKKYLVTNNHVCKTFKSMDFIRYGTFLDAYSGRIKSISRKVLYNNKDVDLCILEGISKNSYLVINDRPAYVGERVVLSGHPKGKKLTITYGEVISNKKGFTVPATEEDIENGCTGDSLIPTLDGRCLRVFTNALQTTVPMLPGSSGSPLMTIDGRVVGVAAWYDADIAWTSAVSLHHLKLSLKQAHKIRSKKK